VTDRRLGQRAFQAVQQQMGPEAAAQAAVEDEALAAHEPTGLHDFEELSSDESDDKTYAPPSPRAHDGEAGGSQQVPPAPSAEASSIATLTRLFEEQQRQAQIDREENREIMREMRRQQQVMAEQQQAQAAAQQQLNMLMMSMIQQLAQQTGAVLSQLPVPGAPHLPQPVPPPFTSTGAPYFTTVAPVGTAAPPVSTAPALSPVSGFGMTSLLAPSVAELVSASVAQPTIPVSTLPTATPARDVGPSEDVTVALAPESSPLLSRTLEFETPTSVVVPSASQIEDLLAAGYTETELSILSAQPATAPAIVATTTTADPSDDASTDRNSLHLSSSSDDDGGSASQFSIQACDAAAPSEPPAE